MRTNQKPTNKVEEIKHKVLKQEEERPKGPITETNIGEHREATIETAKKYKYPFQQAKHKILIGATAAFVLVLIIFSVFSWWMLYIKQDTSDFYYTATKFIPIPVAEVDGDKVSYGDYMRRVRASIHYLENQENRNLSTEDGLRELNYTRRINMDEAEKVVYASKIAREQDIFISEEEIDANVARTLSTDTTGAISERAFENSIWRYYGWNMSDYRHIVKERLLLREAMFAVDSVALNRANDVKNQLNQGSDFATLVASYSDDEATKNNGGDVGVINVNDIDSNGLIAAAQKLSVGQVSEVLKGIDAFYIIHLLEKTDTTVRFLQIKISLQEFNQQFASLQEQGKIIEFITIESDE